MTRTPIAPDAFCCRPHDLWSRRWLLLAAGDMATGAFNAMTVGWGSFGTMWAKPFAQVVVRPTRYTIEFMEAHDSFTLCAFGDEYRGALQVMGTKSGRDLDKVAETGLTPIAASSVAAPAFDEAELVIECRKTYWQDMDPAQFVDPAIDKNYADRDYHRIYFGEILAIHGTGDYTCPTR